MLIYIIFFIILIITIIFLIVLHCFKNYEHYKGNLIYINISKKEKKKLASTPLHILKSKLIKFDETLELPLFFCYNFRRLSPVQNQGVICGSCWAFVTSGLISDRVSINTNKHVLLSSQQLLQCYDYPNGCEGASPEKVFKWMKSKKIKLTSDTKNPYLQFNTDRIRNICTYNSQGIGIKSTYRIVDFIDHDKPNKYILAKNIENMKRDLILNGPFFATINIYDNFFDFEETAPYSEYYGEFIGGHAIIIVGYSNPGQDRRKGYNEGYWICRNSWGKQWPRGNPFYPGYFTIIMGKNCCGIESRCGAVQPDVKHIKPLTNIIFDKFPQFASKFLL